VSSTIRDLNEFHRAFTRLTEKFKVFWAFHQFLKAMYGEALGEAPGYQIDFQGLYDRIRSVPSILSTKPGDEVLETLQRLDARLDAARDILATADVRISASRVRRFLENSHGEDERLHLSLSRFYFLLPELPDEAFDKLDFLLTLVGSRQSLDDGRFLARFPLEFEKLFGSLLALVHRTEPSEDLIAERVTDFAVLRRDIVSCTTFDELTGRGLLDRLRRLKRTLGASFYSTDVLRAIVETNLAAKNRFRDLYEAEERWILEASGRLLEAGSSGALGKGPLEAAFQEFRAAREAFERQRREGVGVRVREVVRLAEAIEPLLARLGGGEPGDDAGMLPFPEAVEAVPDAGFLANPEIDGGPPPPEPTQQSRHEALTRDPVTAPQASRLLYLVEALEEGTESGRAASHGSLASLRLEPWEVRAVRRLAEGGNAAGEERARDLLFFDAATLRLRLDEDAQVLRAGAGPGTDAEELARRLEEAPGALSRAQELDRRFRQELEGAVAWEEPESLNALHRSRFRLLRTFSGLWLLHNARARPKRPPRRKEPRSLFDHRGARPQNRGRCQTTERPRKPPWTS